MANVSSTPKFSGIKYRVVNELGEGAGSKYLPDQRQDLGGQEGMP